MLARALIIATCATAVPAAAQDARRFFVVDFEGHPEGTEIFDQYAAAGVYFAVTDTGEYPLISTPGEPLAAFATDGGLIDEPVALGAAALTDPPYKGETRIGQDIDAYFYPPVSDVRFHLLDVDGAEFFRILAFDEDGSPLAALIVAAGDPGTGDGAVTRVDLPVGPISRVCIDAEDRLGVGYAIDDLSFFRRCEDGVCGTHICAYQESAPGTGDFEQNFLGAVRAFPAHASTPEVYQWSVGDLASWNGRLFATVPERSHVAFADTSDGLALSWVHDSSTPTNGDGGAASTQVEIVNDPDGAYRAIEDDPVDLKGAKYTGEPGDSFFTASQTWGTCCTDGQAIAGIDGQWTVYIAFAHIEPGEGGGGDSIEGLEEWGLYSSDGYWIPLELEAGRRVMLRTLDWCVADANTDCRVDIFDFLAFQTAFGNGDPGADLAAPYGVVNLFDFLAFQSAFGNGC